MFNTAFSALLAMNGTKHLTAGLKKLLEMYNKKLAIRYLLFSRLTDYFGLMVDLFFLLGLRSMYMQKKAQRRHR